ncbi:MAG: antitoxin YefM [Clostridia bacterium]|nr:antitoxin YefM [Clostridia bacterium]
MSMLAEYQFTEARRGFSGIYNRVFNALTPVVIKRKQNEQVLVIRPDLEQEILARYSLKPEVLQEDDGSVTLALDALELAVNAPTKDEAIKALVEDLKFYARDYIERSQLFLNSPNRRQHLPYLLRVLLCNSEAEIQSLLELN